MKRMDVSAALERAVREESQIATLHEMLEAQIRALEALLVLNEAKVRDPAAWNVVAGFITQLRFYAPRIFYTPETNLDWLNSIPEGAPAHPLAGMD